MQGVLRNPLADPFLLGVSSGAALGAGVVLTLGTGIIGGFGTAQGAMLGAFAALSLALLLGRADKGTATGRDIGGGCRFHHVWRRGFSAQGAG